MDILQSVKSKQHYFFSHSGRVWLECFEKDLETGYERNEGIWVKGKSLEIKVKKGGNQKNVYVYISRVRTYKISSSKVFTAEDLFWSSHETQHISKFSLKLFGL